MLAVVVAAGCEAAPSTAPASAGGGRRTARRGRRRRAPTIPGHELYGYLPYWEMDDGIDAHLRDLPLTTLALFSVTHTSRGAINTSQPGLSRDHGGPRPAADRGGARPGDARRARLHELRQPARTRACSRTSSARMRSSRASSTLVDETGVDGINVDVEVLDPTLVPAYGLFVERLRAAVARARTATRPVSVATGAGPTGAAMAKVAADAGADRIFLMGYDYRVASLLARRLGAARPVRRRAAEPPLVARPVRDARRAGGPAAAGAAAVRAHLARRGAGHRGARDGSRRRTGSRAQHRDILRDDDDRADARRGRAGRRLLQASDGSWGAPTPGRVAGLRTTSIGRGRRSTSTRPGRSPRS